MTAAVHRCLVLGGARSGKSAWAERRFAGEPIRYLATGYPAADDSEWAHRIRVHQARRPASWQTLETVDVAAALRAADERPLLVDCLTLWLTRTMDAAQAWDLPHSESLELLRPRLRSLAGAVAEAAGESVLVSNEVGSGVVPDSAAGRRFADLLGELNCLVAAQCDEVVLTVAGIPVPVKGGPPRWRRL